MPVDRLQGARHPVTVWNACPGESKFPNWSAWPCLTTGGFWRPPASPAPPGRYWKPLTATPLSSVWPSGNVVGSATPGWGSPPWFEASGKWPWVTVPVVLIGWVKGSGALASGGAIHTTMIPIDSYQDASWVSYVALTRSCSPLWTATRQSGSVAVIDRSHDTGPLGS